MAELIIKERTYPQDYYDQLEGDTPFVLATNKKVAEYWVKTGREMPIMTAALEVLADLYDEVQKERESMVRICACSPQAVFMGKHQEGCDKYTGV